MAEGQLVFNAAKLRRGLRILAHGQGIYRPDICNLLRGRLSELRVALNVEVEKEPEVVQSALGGILHGHIYQLAPRPSRDISLTAEARLRQYRRIVVVSFNMIPDIIGAEETTLQKRRAWLADDVEVSERTTQRDLDHAIDQIVERIMSGVPTPPAPLEALVELAEVQSPSVIGEPHITDEADSAAQLDPPEDSAQLDRRRRQRRRWLIVTSAGAVVLILAATLVIINPFRSSTTAADPITIQLSPLDLRTGQNTAPSLVVPKELNNLERPPVFDGQNPAPFDTWKANHHAVYAERMSVSFLVRSGRTAPTIIVGARVKVVRRDAPMSGTWVVPQGAGTQPVRQLYADLDALPPKITKDGGWEFPLRVSQTDPEAFSLVARTQNCHCFWIIELDVMLPDGKSQVVTVDDNGKPFELTSPVNTKDKLYLEFK